MFEITTLAVNPEFANEGKWVEYPGTPAKFKIARFNNRKAELARHEANLELYKRLQAQLKSSTPEEFTDTEALQVQAKVMSQHILKDWEGISKNGESLAYSPEAAYELLADPAYYDFYMFVFNEAISHENYSAETEEAVVEDVKTSADS